MNTEALAPIFLDNKPVDLKDPKPRVSSVLSAGGRPGVTEVKWLQTQTSNQGTFLRPDHTLDRTSTPTKPIYLSSQARNSTAPATAIAADPEAAAPSLLPWPTDAKKATGVAPAAKQHVGPKQAPGDVTEESDEPAKPTV